ncbi:MAG TPA: ACP S-malonyltransferase, partial [Trueperaceae bacterium]|nr:ACP S-malonyltransferase [Trueperaceae bacterium]
AAAFAAYKEAKGKSPSFAAGHSLGEYTAHVASGALTIEDAVVLVNKRGKYMQEAVAEGVGAMAAILKTDNKTIEEVCKNTAGVVEIANYNSDGQTVISGEKQAVEAASEKLKSLKARAIPLKVSAPFHCSLMQSAADKLTKDLEKIEFKQADFPVISNVKAEIIKSPNQINELLAQQVTASVRWLETIQNLDSLGVTSYYEFGSGKVLTGLIKRILKDAQAFSITEMANLEEVI